MTVLIIWGVLTLVSLFIAYLHNAIELMRFIALFGGGGVVGMVVMLLDPDVHLGEKYRK